MSETLEQAETEAPPVDRSQRTTTSGIPEEEAKEIEPSTGMQKAYVILTAEERAKGFVRPVRTAYRHVGIRPKYPLRDLTDEQKERYAEFNYAAYEEYPESESLAGRYWTQEQLESGCGSVTTMNIAIAETYARDPKFYGGTFCSFCGKHFPVGEHGEFEWLDGEKVGT